MRGRQRAGEGCELPKRNLYGLLMAEMEPLWGIAGNLYGARDLASHCFYRGGAEPLWAIPHTLCAADARCGSLPHVFSAHPTHQSVVSCSRPAV